MQEISMNDALQELNNIFYGLQEGAEDDYYFAVQCSDIATV